MQRFLPFLAWVRTYDVRRDLGGDVSAGLTVAVMLVPQAMAYAMLAGLPPIVGLYASVIPLLAYAVLGTSRQLAVGPVAMDSLLVAVGVGALAAPGSGEYVVFAVVLAGMVGALQLAMGLLRLGSLVSFLSHPVISGFTSAAAIVIGLSQLKLLLGVDLARSSRLHEIVASAWPAITETHPLTLAIGLGAIVLLRLLKRWNRRFPGALAVVFLGTLLTWALDLHERGVAIVGAIPAGLPSPSLPAFSLDTVGDLAWTAVALALVGFTEAVSMGKAYARKNRYEVDANRELLALGAANLSGFFFGAYPVTGGLGRTAVNAEAGARTPLAGVITAVGIGLALLFLTPLFYYLPEAVLAAIVMAAVLGLVDVRELVHLLRVKRSDAALWAATFVVTLFVGIQEGIAAGVVLSLALFVRRSTSPHHAVLGRLPGTTTYRNVKNYPEAETVPGVLIWRFDASFYFANATYFRDQVDRLTDTATCEVHALILDASGINDLDASAESMLHDIHARLAGDGVALFLAGVKRPVLEVMRRGGFVDLLGADHIFLTVHEAVEAALHAVSAPAAAPDEERWHETRNDREAQGDEPWPTSKPSTIPAPSR